MSEQRVQPYWFDYYFDNMDPFSHEPNPVRGTVPTQEGMKRIMSAKQIRSDMSETETELRITCDVPGWSKNDLKVEVDDNHKMLTISGEKSEEKKEENAKWHMVERSTGKFSRSFTLPSFVSTEKVNCKLEDGVLKIVFTKTQKSMPKKMIAIE